MSRQLVQGQACPWLDKQWWMENETRAEIFGRFTEKDTPVFATDLRWQAFHNFVATEFL